MFQFRATLLGALIFGFSVSRANAGAYIDGNILLEQCTTEKNNDVYFQNHAYCLAYIEGVADSFSCNSPLFGFRWRVAPGIIAHQLEMVVTSYLKNHPEALHYSASSLVAEALDASFPCK
jgi:hypothetical protein